MKKLIFTLMIIAVTVSVSFSQSQTQSNKGESDSYVLVEESEKELQNIARDLGFSRSDAINLQTLMGKATQAAVIKQVGDHNFASVTQSGAGQFAYILQDGSYLDAELTMEGSDNNAIVKQRGSYLVTEILLEGSNNNFKLLQKGSYLDNNIKLLNVSGMDLFFLQTESQFLYSQNGGNGIPLKITTEQSIPAIIVTNN